MGNIENKEPAFLPQKSMDVIGQYQNPDGHTLLPQSFGQVGGLLKEHIAVIHLGYSHSLLDINLC